METELASQPLPNQQKQAPSYEQQIHTLNMILSATTAFIYLFDKQGRYRFAERGWRKNTRPETKRFSGDNLARARAAGGVYGTI